MTTIDEKQQYILNARRDGSYTEAKSGAPIWLLSFTDVMALMLTFFVLLYSMSTPDPEKLEEKVGVTMYAEAQYADAGAQAGTDEGANINRMDFALAEDLQYVEALLAETIAEKKMAKFITMKGRGDVLMLYLNPTLQTNNREFLLFLNALEPFLESLDNRLELVGKPDALGIFEDLQTLGRILRSYGYQDAISLTVRDMSATDINPRMAIGIRSNDGRRVVR